MTYITRPRNRVPTSTPNVAQDGIYNHNTILIMTSKCFWLLPRALPVGLKRLWVLSFPPLFLLFELGVFRSFSACTFPLAAAFSWHGASPFAQALPSRLLCTQGTCVTLGRFNWEAAKEWSWYGWLRSYRFVCTRAGCKMRRWDKELRKEAETLEKFIWKIKSQNVYGCILAHISLSASVCAAWWHMLSQVSMVLHKNIRK